MERGDGARLGCGRHRPSLDEDVHCRGLWRVETRVTPPGSLSIPPRKRAFWPDGSLSCALSRRREVAFLARLSAALRPPWLLPPSCAPLTSSASLSGRPSVGCGNRGRLQRLFETAEEGALLLRMGCAIAAARGGPERSRQGFATGEEAEDDGKAVPHRGKCLTPPVITSLPT
jgi:hypothetical protein